MNDYKTLNDMGIERSWEELYEDNVMLQKENQKYKEVMNNIKYYLEENSNQVSEDANYDLMNFIKEV